jgi:hypothetical protein
MHEYGKALIDVEHVKNAPIQGRFTDAFEKNAV